VIPMYYRYWAGWRFWGSLDYLLFTSPSLLNS
jgi:hypothetical protein